MTTAEQFKIWLETIYISPMTGKPLTTGNQYVTGINTLNKKLKLKGEGIFDENTDLVHIRTQIDLPIYWQKDQSSHFNAFVRFRDFYIERHNKNKKPLQRQTDVFKKQQVEISAIEEVIKHYETIGYIVISKEKDNVGWDLEATNLHETLLLEVKGLSGSITSIELTPNEYKNSNDKNAHYKLCIVTSALKQPKLEVYSFDIHLNCWINIHKEKLVLEERTGARLWKE